MKTIKLRLLALLAVILSCTAFANAQAKVTPTYKQSVIQIIDMCNTKDVIVNTCAATFAQSGIMSESTTREAVTEWLDTSWDEILDIYVDAYAKYFSQEDLNNLIGFYQTPTGKKLAEHTSDLATEAQTAMFAKPEIINSLQIILMKYMH